MTHLEIVPYVGDNPVAPDQIDVRINPEYKLYALNLVKEASKVKGISSPKDLDTVNDVQGRIQAALSQIDSVRKAAKSPILSLERAIDKAANGVADELKSQKERISGIHEVYTTQENNRREALKREVHENKARSVAAVSAQLLRAQEDLQKALMAARGAETLEEAAEARRRAALLEEEVRDTKLDLSQTKDAPVIEQVFTAPLVPGATTTERLTVALVNPELFIKNAPVELITRLAEIKLKKMVANDYVDTIKRQQNGNPDYNEEIEFAKLGILVHRSLKTTVRASAKVIS